MGYIGSKPATNFETVRKQVSTTNSGTTITLDFAVSSVQDILVTVNAVVQSYDNYSVSGTTLTLGGTLNNDRVEILYVGRTFQTVTPAVGTVTNDMLSGSIAASKLSSTAVDNTNTNSTLVTGQTEKTSLADADKFLISDSAASGALKYVQKSNLPSGGLTLVSSGTGSSVTNINIDSVFTNSYKAYKFVGGFRPASNSESLWFVYRSGGSNAGNSEYRYVVKGFLAESSGDSEARQNAWGNPYWKVSTNGASNNSNYMQYVDMNIMNPMATSTTFGANYTSTFGTSMLYTGSSHVVYSLFALNFQTAGNYDGLHITFSNGNISSYNYQIYGYNPS